MTGPQTTGGSRQFEVLVLLPLQPLTPNYASVGALYPDIKTFGMGLD